MDTALVLQLRAAGKTLQESLTRAMTAAAALAREYASTPMPGRTWLQHASPTTFGLKAAGWLDMTRTLPRPACATRSIARRSCSLAAHPERWRRLATPARPLQTPWPGSWRLRVPSMPWHTQRDRIAEVSAAFGIACGALGKVGRDLTLLAQSEVAEAVSGRRRGIVVDAAQTESRPRGHGRGRRDPRTGTRRDDPGGDAAGARTGRRRLAGRVADRWPDLMHLTRESADAIAGHARRACAWIRRRCGVISRCAAAWRWPKPWPRRSCTHMSRSDAMALVERLCRAAERDGRPLREVAAVDPDVSRWLSPAEIDRALAPEHFLGAAGTFVDRVLQQWEM